jgi:hypothetical protein
MAEPNRRRGGGIAAVASILAASALLICAGPARAETSIYIAEQPGFSITFKAEGRHVFVTSLRSSGYCKGTPGQPEIIEETGESFLGGPEELERSGRHIHYGYTVTETFYSQEVIDGEIRPDSIIGTYMRATGGPAEGEGPCYTGTPGGGTKVSFEAARYVPFDSELATTPDPTAKAIYFGNAKLIEIYLWIDDAAVTDVRGSALDTCVWPQRRRRKVERSRGAPLLFPPFPLSAPDGSFYGSWGVRNRVLSRSSRFLGVVAEDTVTGTLSETSKGRSGGRVTERCHTGRGDRGWILYRAIRYVPVAY